MTVIAYERKDGYHILVVDRMVTSGQLHFEGDKSWMLDDTCAIATAGTLPTGLVMRQWILEGEDLSKYPESQGTEDWSHVVVVRAGQEAYCYEQNAVKIPLTNDFYAWGSGKGVAYGARHMGASAYQAVEAANRYADGCGFGVTAFRVPA